MVKHLSRKNGYVMKKIVYLLLLQLVMISCHESFIGQPPTNDNRPNSIKNPAIAPIPGGAIITYDLPDDADLLSVRAEYTLHGKPVNTEVSIYTNELKLEGFGNTELQTVNLYTVTRSFVKSDPVKVSFHPLTPPVTTITESVSMREDFGGVQLKWENESGTELAVYLLAEDFLTGEMETADILYTKQEKGLYSLRGFDNTERTFGVCFRDKWDNYSDTILAKVTPLYEIQLDKAKFKQGKLPGDNISQINNSWAFWRLFDDKLDDLGWSTIGGNGGKPAPIRYTIDLGVVSKLSRYKIYQRLDYEYRHFSPKKWKIYGTNHIDPAHEKDLEYFDGDKYQKDWVFMGDFEIIKPSGDGEQITNEDKETALAGHEFVFDLNLPPVRYLRFEQYETWSGGLEVNYREITIWGSDKN